MKGVERDKGIESRDYLRKLLDKYNNEIVIETIKDKKGKYGRYLAKVFVIDVDKNTRGEVKQKIKINVNKLMVESGYAESKKY